MRQKPITTVHALWRDARRRGAGFFTRRAIQAVLFACASAAVPATQAFAQASPVFVDDAPGAAEALRSARGQAQAGNLDTAARVLQRLLESEADRLTESASDELLLTPVRGRAHATLLDDPALLERYRQLESGEAQRQLDAGLHERVARERLLTPAGYEAALRVAQLQLERGLFHAALRQLEELEAHPDRDTDAADLAALAARYAPQARPLAERWGAGDAGAPYDAPDLSRARSGLDPAPALTFEGLVPEPIRSTPLTDEAGEPSGLLGASPIVTRGASGGRVQVDPARVIYPAIAGDLVVISDGAAITALDRFTLEERWRHTTSRGVELQRRGVRRSGFVSPLAVGVWGNTAVAAASPRSSGGVSGDGRLHALDLETGELRWSLDLETAAPDLEGAEAAGVVLAESGLAIVPVQLQVRERRLANSHLAAFDLATGELVWTRLVASAGALPQSFSGQRAAAPMIEEGVIYISEPLGAIAAIELATGRVLWARRASPVDQSFAAASARWPARPSLREGVLYDVEPVSGRVVAIDAATGELIAARPGAPFGVPSYVLVVDDRLVAVSDAEIRSVPLGELETATPEPIAAAPGRVFAGRPSVAGDALLVPADGGFSLLDPATGEARESIAFGNTGNAVLAPAQLAVVDGAGVSSYLVWDAARAALEARMEANPADAAPAVTLAELAHRAGRVDAIMPAVDAALAALRAEVRTASQSQTRRRLFAALDQMIEPEDAAAALPPALLDRLVTRLGQAASTPEERALHLLREGAFALAAGRSEAAVNAYQRVLDDPELATAQVRLDDRVRLARSISGDQLRGLIDAEGPEIYAVFEREARSALSRALPAGVTSALDPALLSAAAQLDPEALTSIGRRYPVAVAAIESWLAAAQAYQQRGRLRGAIGALEEAMAAASGLPHAPAPLVAEVAGRLTTRLVEGGRAAAASAAIARISQSRPDLTFTIAGSPVDVADLERRIAEARTRSPRRARLGMIENDQLATIPGRLTIRPLYRAVEPQSDLALLASDEVLEAWETDPAGGMRLRWSTPLDPTLSLLRVDSGGALASIGDGRTRRLARLDGRTGETLWETRPFDAGFAPGSAPRAGETVAIPAGAIRPRDEILVALRNDAATLVDRSGRAAGYDVAEGRNVWSAHLPIDDVHDAAETGGLLIVVGSRREANPDARLEHSPAGLIVDAGSGRVVAELDFGSARPHWVRETDDGIAVVGTDRGIYGFELTDGSRRWLIDEPVQRTEEAWSFPGRLIVMDSASQLWQIETETGELSRSPLDSRGRLQKDSGEIEVVAAGDHAVMALPRGLVIFDRRGELTGLDQRDGLTRLGPRAFSQRYAVALDPHGFEPRLYELRLLELETGRLRQSQRLELPTRPQRVDLIDGRILISAGTGTLVIDAPGPDEPEGPVDSR